MTPKERAISALECRQPDIVPHLELEMQLMEEYFRETFVSEEKWADADARRAREYSIKNAELFIKTAERFNYCIILYRPYPFPPEQYLLESIRILKELDNGRHMLFIQGDSTIGIPEGNDMDALITDLFENPQKIKAEQERGIEEKIKRGKMLMKAGMDGFLLNADYCLNTGPFLSPAMFCEFVTPYLTKLVKCYRDMGAYTIKHTDGNIMPILDQLVKAGPHALHSLDPMAGVDIKKVKSFCGNEICLIGNVNAALMQTGTDEEILESCRYAMENGKPGGGYIFSTSSVIFKGMPKHSYDIMIDYYNRNNAY